MGEIYVATGIGLNPNEIRRAIIKSVSYIEPEYSTIGQKEIYMETEDGLICDGWFINNYCSVHLDEFLATSNNIMSGAITKGTEVTIVYNPNGIMYFYL